MDEAAAISTAADDLSTRVKKAASLAEGESNAEALDHHVRWEMDVLMSRLAPTDLTADEVLAINVILAGAHTRKLARSAVPETPRLRLVTTVAPPVDEGVLDGDGQAI